MLPFSFSYADNWNIGLKKLVDKKTEVDVIKYMSAQQIKQYYYAHKSWGMKALTFGVRSFFWSGLLYLGFEATANLLEQLANQYMEQQNLENPYFGEACLCRTGDISFTSGESCGSGFVRIDESNGNLVYGSTCGRKGVVTIKTFRDGSLDSSRTTNGQWDRLSDTFVSQVNSLPLCGGSGVPSFCEVPYQNNNNVTFDQALEWVLANKYDDIQNSLNNEPKELLDPATAQKMGLYVPPYITGAEEGEDNNNAPAPFGNYQPSNGVGYGGSVSSGAGGEQKSTFKAPNNKYFIDNGTGAAPVISDEPEQGSSFENQGEVENAPAPKEGEDFVTPPQLQAPEFDISLDVPEKKDYTNLLEQFISNSPVYHILADTEIKTSGAVCSLNATWKGHIIKFSMCEFQSSLEAVGALILMFAHIMAIMIIFRN